MYQSSTSPVQAHLMQLLAGLQSSRCDGKAARRLQGAVGPRLGTVVGQEGSGAEGGGPRLLCRGHVMRQADQQKESISAAEMLVVMAPAWLAAKGQTHASADLCGTVAAVRCTGLKAAAMCRSGAAATWETGEQERNA
jgi:hypothetical protein